MSEKTYVFDSGSNNVSSMLPALLQNRGIDPAYFMGMMNNGGFGGNFGINEIIALVVIAAIFGNNNGGGIFGCGGNNNNSAEREMIMQTLNRNGVDISQLASSLNCSTNTIQNGINNLATQICQLSGQQGMSAQQIINAIQAGNCSLSHALADCCCKTQQIITQGFADLGYATRDQTCAIEKSIESSTSRILEGQRAAEMRELQRDLNQRDRELAQKDVIINNYQQTQTFGAMLAPISNAIGNLQSDVDGIKCKLPKTETIVAAPDYVPINRGINVNYAAVPTCGYGGFGFPYNYPFGFPNGNNGSFF